MWNDITAMILTYNEEANIERTVRSVACAGQILVVDSGSTDATLEILSRIPNVRIVYRPFDDFASQCNYGLTLMKTPLVLSIDADYELSPRLIEEIAGLNANSATSGYKAKFVYRIFGHPLRGTLYPPRVVLYRTDRARYRNEGHGHRVVIDGDVVPLSNPIFHDDRKPLSRFLAAQQSYARREVDHLLAMSGQPLPISDRLRLAIIPAPFAVLAVTLLLRGCIFDGWPGWYYALQRLIAEVMISLEMLDRRIRLAARH